MHTNVSCILRNYNHFVNSIFDIYASVTYLSLSLHIKSGKSALLLASENGHLEVVKYLLSNGANIGDKDNVRYISFFPPRVHDYSLHYLYDTTLE